MIRCSFSFEDSSEQVRQKICLKITVFITFDLLFLGVLRMYIFQALLLPKNWDLSNKLNLGKGG